MFFSRVTFWDDFNSLPKDKMLDWSKFKAFCRQQNECDSKPEVYLVRVENIVRKGENAGHQHVLLFPQCFLKASFSGSLKLVIVW